MNKKKKFFLTVKISNFKIRFLSFSLKYPKIIEYNASNASIFSIYLTFKHKFD